LDLVNQKHQHHQHAKHSCQVLFTVSVVVFQVNKDWNNLCLKT